MKTLAHISDLHFGREEPRIAAGLREALLRAEPDVLVVSGDLTQRAKKKQFRAAQTFLEAIPEIPRIVVPGNHDVSTTNLFERVVRPLERYRRFVTRDLTPFYSDDEVAIAGINTVRLLSTKDGRINRAQVDAACARFRTAGSRAIKVVVTHHPFDLPAEDLKHPTLTRARMAMAQFALCGVDLFLSGHLHGAITLTTAARYPRPAYSAVVAHAGTAISTRTRHEPNGWNLIRVSQREIEVERMVWSGKRFASTEIDRYQRGPGGWQLEGQYDVRSLGVKRVS